VCKPDLNREKGDGERRAPDMIHPFEIFWVWRGRAKKERGNPWNEAEKERRWICSKIRRKRRRRDS